MARHRRDPGLAEHAAAPPPRPLWRRGGPSPRRLDALALAAILVAALALLVSPRAARAAAPVITAVTAQTGGQTVLVTFDQGVFANN
ncbi:MAG: hypothetical protein WEB13_06150, partial [Dehalococcoidia bacterium]